MIRKERLFFIFASGISAVIFVFLSYLVNKDVFRAVDYSLMVNLQRLISRGFDIPFSILSLLGSTEITLVIFGIIFIVVLLRKRHFFLGLFLYFFIFFAELLGKIYINNPLPPKIFNRYALNFHFPSGSLVETHFSFPSGHMARTSFLAIILLIFILWSKRKRWQKIFSTILISLFLLAVFISRIYLGEHWLSDVLGGLVLGTGIAFVSLSFW
ncbi:phosphatase PAP2 family protein [Candidatus Gottesmanbacteria bacterium]|nr:phosphatase PAP2 family protein [Candidatus Gottesmanbacteria bacterium]